MKGFPRSWSTDLGKLYLDLHCRIDPGLCNGGLVLITKAQTAAHHLPIRQFSLRQILLIIRLGQTADTQRLGVMEEAGICRLWSYWR